MVPAVVTITPSEDERGECGFGFGPGAEKPAAEASSARRKWTTSLGIANSSGTAVLLWLDELYDERVMSVDRNGPLRASSSVIMSV